MDIIRRNYYIVTILYVAALTVSLFASDMAFQSIGFSLVLLFMAIDSLWSEVEGDYHFIVYYLNKLLPFVIFLVFGVRYINVAIPDVDGVLRTQGYVVYVIFCIFIMTIRFAVVRYERNKAIKKLDKNAK